MPCVDRTGLYARGRRLSIQTGDHVFLKALIHNLRAEVAFYYGPGLQGIELLSNLLIGCQALPGEIFPFRLWKIASLLIGTGNKATSATDTDIGIYRHNAVITLRGRSRRADIHAGGLITVVAQYRVDELLHRGILSAFTHEDPRKKDTRRQEMLLLRKCSCLQLIIQL